MTTKCIFTNLKNKVILFLKQRPNLYFLAILFIGCLLRIVGFGSTPTGINQDEAFAGYEAFSLANYGVDSWGYHNPVYFISWGSGMNVLETYLALPFVKVFGLNIYTIRLPQVIMSIVCLPITYFLIKEITKNNQIALLAFGLLAISPWHIMASRWGLESNLAPGFLLVAFYFFVKGISKNYLLIFSAIFYGISLYAYAITWAMVPMMIVASGVYILFKKVKISWKYIFISATILFVLASPFILFLLINKGFLPEIKTKFISVPKMIEMRGSELKLSNLINVKSYLYLLKIIFWQGDGLTHNSTYFGLFYKTSIPFMIVGFVVQTRQFVKNIKLKKFDLKDFLVINLFCSIFTVLLVNKANINRANVLHFNLLFSTVIGLNFCIEYFNKIKNLKKYVVIYYSVLAIAFSGFYFLTFNNKIAVDNKKGLKECVQFVNENNFEKINVDTTITHSQILFYDKTPTPLYLESVKYKNYPSKYLKVESFTKYYFLLDYQDISGQYNAYIIKTDKVQIFIDLGYAIKTYNVYSVAYKT